jgi:UDP-GlcNAc:undecaprenyl-phosphate GlcNAc-1-phosphate transferase
MSLINPLIAGLVGLLVSLGLISLILRASRLSGFGLRESEGHHTHEIPVPRLGGLALAGALVVVMVVGTFLEPDFLQKNQRWLIISSSLLMFGLGLWDDLFTLGAKRKLLGQIGIASIAYFCGIAIEHFKIPFTGHIVDLGWWGLVVTVFWLVAMTNLINLIDGVDGLAGGICLMLMVLLSYVNLQSGSSGLIAIGMAGALLGFLRFNFPPARIYLGDGGAYFLGFMIGAMTIVASQKGTILAALAAPLFVLALPIIDTSLAILRRGLRGLPLFRPDRSHLHHRLLNLGYSRRKVVVGVYVFTAVFLLLAFMAIYWRGQYFALFMGIGALVIILTASQFSFSREWFTIGRTLGNSLESRAHIRYALTLSQWLALEGTRCQTINELAENLVFIARKLGFASVRIQLEADERVWPLISAQPDPLHVKTFRHKFGRKRVCLLEFNVACPPPSLAAGEEISGAALHRFSIQAELVAEGWNKAIKDWKRLHHTLPTHFADKKTDCDSR